MKKKIGKKTNYSDIKITNNSSYTNANNINGTGRNNDAPNNRPMLDVPTSGDATSKLESINLNSGVPLTQSSTNDPDVLANAFNRDLVLSKAAGGMETLDPRMTHYGYSCMNQNVLSGGVKLDNLTQAEKFSIENEIRNKLARNNFKIPNAANNSPIKLQRDNKMQAFLREFDQANLVENIKPNFAEKIKSSSDHP